MNHTLYTLKRQKLTFFILLAIVLLSLWPAANNNGGDMERYEASSKE